MPIIAGSLGLAWTVLMYIPQIMMMESRTWWGIVMISRVCIVGILIAAFSLTAQYLPLPLGSCANDYEWRPGNNIPSNTPTLFEVLPIKSSEHGASGKFSFYSTSCSRVVELWKYELALAILILLSTCSTGILFARLHTMPRRYLFKNS
ncbi:uncharacterized protein BJX67DRAFT_346731 [Aspergillus lucknowensis]|uniref:Uncharacterized protein n=1 Tax=Aspergillus lucknowensis TaxID=176173 RepID=A0ABR4LZP2_9EURO